MASRSSAAERQRRYRERRRRGICVVPVEVTCDMLDAFDREGHLHESPSVDPCEIGKAVATVARRFLAVSSD